MSNCICIGHIKQSNCPEHGQEVQDAIASRSIDINEGDTVELVPIFVSSQKSGGASEEDFILLLSELKLIVYGLEGSEEYPGLQFEACGVDSYSLSDRARECMSMNALQDSDQLGELSDTLAKDVIFFCELRRWLEDVEGGEPVHEVVNTMREAYCMD